MDGEDVKRTIDSYFEQTPGMSIIVLVNGEQKQIKNVIEVSMTPGEYPQLAIVI